MLLIEPIDDLSIGKKKGRVNDSDGRKLLRSVRKMKSAVGGLTSQNARSFYTKTSSIEYRRAVVKARIVKHGKGWNEIRAKHIDYIQRGGVADDGGKGVLFTDSSDEADGATYLENSKNDEHEFRFIIAPESSAEIDLKWLTREVIKQMERDLDTKLKWVASDHYNTDNPHVHVVMRGVKDDGTKLTISKDYISNGIRNRTREILTRELGLRSAREIEVEYRNDINADRFTSIDRFIKNHVKEAMVADGNILEFKPMKAAASLNAHMRVDMLKGRLEFLRESGLAEQTDKHTWKIDPAWEKILRDNGIRNDIIKIMHREAKLGKADCEVYSRAQGNRISGTIVWRGIHEEMTDKQFIVVRDSQAKNHYVVLDKYSLPDGIKVGDKVTVNLHKTTKEKGERQFLRVECERLSNQVKNAPNRVDQSRNNFDQNRKRGRRL